MIGHYVMCYTLLIAFKQMDGDSNYWSPLQFKLYEFTLVIYFQRQKLYIDRT
jgi:hypothetical protein